VARAEQPQLLRAPEREPDAGARRVRPDRLGGLDQRRRAAAVVVDAGPAPRRLVFWWSGPGGEATRVEIELDECDDGTRVRVTESRPLEILDGRDLSIEFGGAGGGAAGPVALAGALC
jgi:hypothetical protein